MLGGPNAKTPGILLAALSMSLLVRRRWFRGALTGSLAFLAWQPLGVYVAVAVVAGLLTSNAEERRGRLPRILAGAAIPVAAMTLYLWLVGAGPKFVEAAIRFPVTGVERRSTLLERVERFELLVGQDYGTTRVLLWVGLLLLAPLLVAELVRARHDLRSTLSRPYVSVVCASFAPLAAYSIFDFQGTGDLYPLLPYAAVALGGAVGLAVDRVEKLPARRVATAVSLVAVAALVAVAWALYSGHRRRDTHLVEQRTTAAALERILAPDETLLAIGDPTPLVLTGRRNPDRYIYLGSGVAPWMLAHTAGGFEGWKARIRAADPAIIVVKAWSGRYAGH